MKTGDNRMIPLPISIVGLLSSIAWFSYGILPIFNVYIVIPNGIGKYFLNLISFKIDFLII